MCAPVVDSVDTANPPKSTSTVIFLGSFHPYSIYNFKQWLCPFGLLSRLSTK